MNPYLQQLKQNLSVPIPQIEANLVTEPLVEMRHKQIKYPIYIRKFTTDYDMYQQVLLHNDYHNVNIKPEIVVDAGCNIGLFTILVKNLFPMASVICLEPDGSNVQMMRKNLAPYDNVYIEHCGLWSNDAKLVVTEHTSDNKCGIIVEESLNGDVDGICIDSLMAKHNLSHIDILKLDIETSEKQVFSSNYERWLPKVKCLVIEFHDRMQEGCAQAFFIAINKVYKRWYYDITGENTIVYNLDLLEK
jgi:FkbM family methyltransferase